MDAYKNLALGTVATPPSPATTGTSLVLTAGQGARFPAPPFDVTLFAPGTIPDPSNAEIARVTAMSGDTITAMTRNQYGTTAQSVAAGWYVDNAMTANFIGQIIATFLPLAGGTMTGAVAMGSNKITGLANGTLSNDAAAFGQIPTALPPNGAAGGDLAGTYPNPTLGTVGSAGTVGDSTHYPIVTTDAKGRVTGMTSQAVPSSGAMTLISSQILAAGAPAVTFSSIPGTYHHLKLIAVARSASAALDTFLLELGGASTYGHDFNEIQIITSTVTGVYAYSSGSAITLTTLAYSSSSTGVRSRLIVDVESYANASNYKTFAYETSLEDGLASVSRNARGQGTWRNTAAMSAIGILTGSGSNFVVGSEFYLYGIT